LQIVAMHRDLKLSQVVQLPQSQKCKPMRQRGALSKVFVAGQHQAHQADWTRRLRQASWMNEIRARNPAGWYRRLG
jgi:GH24 family phage-related lysozyme (muramidase)